MFRNGDFVAKTLKEVSYMNELREEQIQPHGVDLTLGQVDAYSGTFNHFKEYTQEPWTHEANNTVTDDSKVYHLNPGCYEVMYDEAIKIPEGHVGFVYPRSTMMRNGAMIFSAHWDMGYEGKGIGMMNVYNPTEIEVGSRVAQLCLMKAEESFRYSGQYQGENLEDFTTGKKDYEGDQTQ